MASITTASGGHLLQLAEETRRAADDILGEGTPENTKRSYSGAMRYWTAWHQLRLGEPLALPLGADAVIQFVVDHLARTADDGGSAWQLPESVDRQLVDVGVKRQLGPFKISTIVHRVSVLSKVHQLKGLEQNPITDPRVQTLLMRAKKVAKQRGEDRRQKHAITRDELDAMVATCEDSLLGARDRALLLLGWASGGRRRSELAEIKLSDLRRTRTGFSLSIRNSKTNQDGTNPSLPKPVTGRAAEALDHWLAVAGIADGYLFRRVDNETVGSGDKPLSVSSIYNIVKARAAKAGLPDASGWSPHSLRSGFVTEAGRRKAPIGDVMAMTDHRQVATLVGYYRAGELERSPVSNMLDDETNTTD